MHDDVTKVVLVRHARPEIDPAHPAGTWTLAADAGAAVDRLASNLAGLGVDSIVTSPEPKALATGTIIARALDVPLSEDDAFREQGLDTVPWIPAPEGFVAAVRDHFARPDEAVLGDEPSATAAARFAAGVERALALHRFPIVVTHGRIMCGYLHQATGVDPMEIWPSLRMPDALVVDLDNGSIARSTAEAVMPLFRKDTR